MHFTKKVIKKVSTTRNPHHKGEKIRLDVPVWVPASLEEVEAFGGAGEALRVCQFYFAKEAMNRVRQKYMEVVANPDLTGAIEVAEAYAEGQKTRKAAPEVNREVAQQILENEGMEAFLAYVEKTGVTIS